MMKDKLIYLYSDILFMDNPLAYPLSDEQKKLLQQKEMCVHGIPIEILSRANLFVNGL
jgi:hypothetical protein